jgi:hypothetical protein
MSHRAQGWAPYRRRNALPSKINIGDFFLEVKRVYKHDWGVDAND